MSRLPRATPWYEVVAPREADAGDLLIWMGHVEPPGAGWTQLEGGGWYKRHDGGVPPVPPLGLAMLYSVKGLDPEQPFATEPAGVSSERQQPTGGTMPETTERETSTTTERTEHRDLPEQPKPGQGVDQSSERVERHSTVTETTESDKRTEDGK